MTQPESYSSREIDLKFENVEQRLDHKLDRLDSKLDNLAITMQAGFDVLTANMNNKFNLIDKDITWLKWLIGGVLFLLLGIIASGGIKWALHP